MLANASVPLNSFVKSRLVCLLKPMFLDLNGFVLVFERPLEMASVEMGAWLMMGGC